MPDLSLSWIVTFLVVLALMMLRTALIGGAVWVWLRYSAFADQYRIYRLGYEAGQLRGEVRATFAVIACDAVVISLVRKFELVNFVDAAGLGHVLATFVLLFVWMEFSFYFSHRLLHTPGLYWIHRQHHLAKVTNPLTALSFSLLERTILIVGLIGFIILGSLVFPICFAGVLAYGLVNYSLNVLGHCNVEFVPAWFARSTVGRLFFTPSYHALHHARFGGHYGLFTTVLDRLFGTVHADYMLVYDRAHSGQGMARLNETLPLQARAE